MAVGPTKSGGLSAPIGDMTKQELSRFILQAVQNAPANLPPSLTTNEVETTDLLTISGDVALSDQAVATLKKYLGL